jgi:hypothetical protein
MDGDDMSTDELAAAFPAWDIAPWPGSLRAVSAYWQSDDGRHRRYLVRRTPGELLSALQAAEREG